MAFLNDRVLDNGLFILTTEATRLDICSREPTGYAEATADWSLGNKAPPVVGRPADRAPDGRKVVVAAIGDGKMTRNGVATHWAITGITQRLVLATGALREPMAITAGNIFTLDEFDIGIPGAAPQQQVM